MSLLDVFLIGGRICFVVIFGFFFSFSVGISRVETTATATGPLISDFSSNWDCPFLRTSKFVSHQLLAPVNRNSVVSALVLVIAVTVRKSGKIVGSANSRVIS